MIEKTNFRICYDGKNLREHEMDISILAPALIAIDDLFKESNKVVYGKDFDISVNVKGTFNAGSFYFDLSIVQHVTNTAITLFSSPNMNALANLLEIVGLPGATGVISLILWLKKRKISKIENTQKDKVKIILEDNDSKEVTKKEIELFRNPIVRGSIQKIITEPLKNEGIEKFQTKDEKGNLGITVNKEESKNFISPELKDELLSEQTIKTNLQLITISFAEDKKWRFTDGTTEYPATVKDEDFIKKVQDNKETFAKNDILTVELCMKQWLKDNGMKTEYEVVKVLNHRSTYRQIELPLQEQKDEGNKNIDDKGKNT